MRLPRNSQKDEFSKNILFFLKTFFLKRFFLKNNFVRPLEFLIYAIELISSGLFVGILFFFICLIGDSSFYEKVFWENGFQEFTIEPKKCNFLWNGWGLRVLGYINLNVLESSCLY